MTAPQELVLAVAGRIQKEKAQRGGWESKQRGGRDGRRGPGCVLSLLLLRASSHCLPGAGSQILALPFPDGGN